MRGQPQASTSGSATQSSESRNLCEHMPLCLWSLEEPLGPPTPRSPSLASSQPHLVLQSPKQKLNFNQRARELESIHKGPPVGHSAMRLRRTKPGGALPGTRRKETFCWHLGQRPTLPWEAWAWYQGEASQTCFDKDSLKVSMVLPSSQVYRMLK